MALSRGGFGPLKSGGGIGLAQTPGVAFSRKVCSNCTKAPAAGKSLLACAKCAAAFYCSKECQKQHWAAGHKQLCFKPAPTAAGAVASTAANKASVAPAKLSAAQEVAASGQCVICLGPDAIDKNASRNLPCGHRFHSACVDGLASLGVVHACPICRPGTTLDGGLDEAEQMFEVATRRLFVLVQRAARGDMAWSSLSANDSAEVATVLKLLRKAVKLGSAAASNVLGLLYYMGHGVAVDDKEAVQHWSHAADGKPPSAAALFNLGAATKEGRAGGHASLHERNTGAFAFTKRAAELDYPQAQNNLGKMYELGDGCPLNEKESLQWTLKAAGQGFVPAQARMAAYCNTGFGSPKMAGKGAASDPAQAFMWLQLAATGGDATAAAAVGVCYEVGHGVAQSDEEAVRWFTRAADAGDVTGQFKLGCMFVEEKGMRAARVNPSAAADSGNAGGDNAEESSHHLSLEGVDAEPLRVAHALACFVFAAEQGHDLAQQLAEELRKSLPAKDSLATPDAVVNASSDPAAAAMALAEAATEAAAKEEAAAEGNDKALHASEGNGNGGESAS